MLDALRQVVQDLGAAPGFRASLDLLVARVSMILDAEVSSIYLRDRTTGRFVLVANEGLETNVVGQVSLAAHEGLVGLVAERAEPVNLDKAPAHSRFLKVAGLREDVFNAFLGVPIVHVREVLGVFVIQDRRERRYDEDEVAFLATLAAQIASHVSHAEATGDIHGLARRGDAKSPEARFQGVPGVPGIGVGTAYVVLPAARLELVPDQEATDIDAELEIFERAIGQARADIELINEQMSKKLGPEERELFDAYLHMLDDAALAGDVRDGIRRGQWAQGALKRAILEQAATFEQMQDSYLRERSADVRELGQRVLANLQDVGGQRPPHPDNMVLVAEEVTAPMMADFPIEQLRGIVSLKGSRNSHGAILADALGIPTVMGAIDVPIYTVENQTVIVDGYYGEVFVNPSAVVRDTYGQFQAEEEEFARELEGLRDLPSETRDGVAINLWVNIGLVSEITRSLDRGAEGIGLFRTEVPFAMGDRFPTEEEQRAAYREHMEAFDPRPVTMRTLDIGGDKPLSYFPIEEENPFLGWRGIRVTLDHPEIFLGQVRAMLKANAGLECILRIMLPMVSRIEQIAEAQTLIGRAHREVVEEGYDVKTPMVGVMIEVPAAIYLTREIARMVDFLAVGSNDLTQYMLAVDRNNPRVADLFEEVHPAMLIALREIAKSCHAEDKPVGICGELAGTPEGAVLCVGMGYDVLSMNAANLPRVKWVIRSVSLRDCRLILARALRMRSSGEILTWVRDQLVEAGLERAVPHHEVPAILS